MRRRSHSTLVAIVLLLSALSLHLILSAVLIGMALGVDRWRRAQ